MSQKHSIAARRGQLRGMCVLILTLALDGLFQAPAQAQNPCETALQSTTGIVELTPSSPLSFESSVAEWESEIIKFKTTRAGLLTLDVEETGAEASIETQEGSEVRMVNRASAAPGTPVLTPVVPSKVYCLRLSPEAASGSLGMQLQLTDICHLGPNADDHGNSFACASEIASGASQTGALTAGDRDVFAFTLATGGVVDIEGAGGVAVNGQLFDATGTLLVTEADRGSGLGFLISETLAAGRYYVRVTGSGSAQGSYTLSLDVTP